MSDIVIGISSVLAHNIVQDAVVSCMVQVCLLMLFLKWSPDSVGTRMVVILVSCAGMLPVMMAVPSINAVPMCGIAGCLIRQSIEHVLLAVRKKTDDEPADVLNL